MGFSGWRSKWRDSALLGTAEGRAALWLSVALVLVKKWEPPAALDNLFYAAIGKNIQRTGDYLHFFVSKGYLDPIYDHMPLTYWVTGFVFSVFGVNDFTARLYPLLMSLLAYLLVFAIGKRWGGPFRGLMAVVAFALCTESTKWNGALLHDVPLSTYCLGAFYFFLLGRDRSRFFYAAAVCFSLAVLSKGPVAFGVPLGILVWSGVSRDFQYLRRGAFWGALVVVCVILAIPLLPVLSFEGQSIYAHFGKQKAGYASVAVQSLWAFFAYGKTMVPTAFPTLVALFLSVPYVRGERYAKEWALSAWVGLAFLIPLSCFHVKFPHYLLPLYPYLALCASLYPARALSRCQPRVVAILRGAAVCFIVLAAVTPLKVTGKRNKEILNLVRLLKSDTHLADKRVFYLGAFHGSSPVYPTFAFHGSIDLQPISSVDLGSVDWARTYVFGERALVAELRKGRVLPDCFIETASFCVLTDRNAVQLTVPSDSFPHELY